MDFQAEEGYLDYGDIVVGSSASKHVILFNNSICSLHYRLLIDQTMDGPYPEEITKGDKLGKNGPVLFSNSICSLH